MKLSRLLLKSFSVVIIIKHKLDKRKMLKAKQWQTLFKIAFLTLIVSASLSLPALADSNSSTSTGDGRSTVTQAYSTTGQLQNGMIVGLSPKTNQVFALTSDSSKQMQGVVVSANSSPFTISNNSESDQVFVASLGRYTVLVSNQNGAIVPGDFIAISSLAGIGMKATGNQTMIVGRAVTGFDGKNGLISNDNLSNGGSVGIGQITVDLGIAHNPLLSLQNSDSSEAMKLFQSIAIGVTGRQASIVKLYVSLAVFTVTAIVVGVVLYSGIRGDMLAVGRNPLAKSSIRRGLLEVVVIAVMVFAIGLGAIYLILRV